RMSLGCCDMTMRLFSFKLNMAFLPAKYGSAKNLNKTVDFGWLQKNYGKGKINLRKGNKNLRKAKENLRKANFNRVRS
ncbi:MAG: hypothetical protein SPE13_04960, partial [Alloprevotella sp.]|nr:hypothetical protein [Alloprevotella sp.]